MPFVEVFYDTRTISVSDIDRIAAEFRTDVVQALAVPPTARFTEIEVNLVFIPVTPPSTINGDVFLRVQADFYTEREAWYGKIRDALRDAVLGHLNNPLREKQPVVNLWLQFVPRVVAPERVRA